ncbi:general secretion pathway protein K [Alteromonadaceae bacterium 2753L.S.0a.02]|nr:general secretion pathway protein K [Alteromonadaceae bacterium 2753L.S.0a.02]
MSGVKQQRGVALVLALLVVALVTAIAVELSWRFDLSLVRAENRWYGVQAYAYLQGAEEFAFMALKFDKEEDNKKGVEIDTLDEFWAQQAAQFPTDEGWVSGKLEDAQARFNLNALAAKAQKPQGKFSDWQKFTAPQRRFIRLLQSINLGETEDEPVYLDQATAINIVEAIIDWMDVDSEVTGFGGAESDYYGQLEPPFVIPNKPMVSVSELNLIRGMTPELYQKLLPLVIALDAQVPLNINTASVEIIRSFNSKKLFYPLALEDAMDVVQNRSGGGYESVEDFAEDMKQYVPDENNGQSNFDTSGLAVFSSYFLFTGETQVGDHIRTSRALLFRNGTEVSTLRRTDANY